MTWLKTCLEVVYFSLFQINGVNVPWRRYFPLKEFKVAYVIFKIYPFANTVIDVDVVNIFCRLKEDWLSNVFLLQRFGNEILFLRASCLLFTLDHFEWLEWFINCKDISINYHKLVFGLWNDKLIKKTNGFLTTEYMITRLTL